MPKIIYDDKNNKIAPINPDQQATAEDFNAVKESINTLYVRFVDDGIIKFYGDSSSAGTPTTNDYRIVQNGVYLDIDRYNGTVWENQSRIGGSFFVPNYIEIIREATAGSLLLRDSTGLRNLVSSTNFSRGIIAGDITGNSFIVGLNEVFKTVQSIDYVWSDVQTDDTQQFTGNTFYVNLTTTPGDGFFTEKFELSPVAVPVDNAVQIQVFLQSDLINPVWQNVTEAEFLDGIGANIDPTTGEVMLEPKFTGIPDTALRVVINSVVPITLKGSNALGTDMYFRSYDSDIAALPIVAYPAWRDGEAYTSNVSKIWQDNDIYICNTTGVQSTDFVTNEALWDALGSLEYAEKTNVLELDNTTPFVPSTSYEPATKKYVDDIVGANVVLKNGYDAATNTPNLEVAPTGILLGWMYLVTVAGTFFTKNLSVGDALICNLDDPQVEDDWIILERNLDAATIKLLYESNSDTNAFTDADQTSVSNLSGTNTGDVGLSSADPTQEGLSLTNQVLTANLVTQSTDGLMSSEDKLKCDNMTGNGVGDHWVSGLEVTESDPKAQTVDYAAGTYIINADLQTIATGGVYDLENGYGSVNHYTDLTSYQHRFVTLYADADNVVKSVGGVAADKKDVPSLPITPVDSVAVALIEIKVDNSAVPKEIKNKDITDTRNAPGYNTDEFVRVSADDLSTGHLSDKLSNGGNITFTIENTGGVETIKADAPGGSGSSIKLAVQAYQMADVTGISSDTIVLWDDSEIDPDSAYDALTGILTIPQSWIDDYDYMTITMSVCARWNGSDTKMTQLSMYYNNGLDTLYMRDGHSKLKSGESTLSLLSLTTAKLPLQDYTSGDYFYGLWENGMPYADMLGGHDNFIQVELTKINA